MDVIAIRRFKLLNATIIAVLIASMIVAPVQAFSFDPGPLPPPPSPSPPPPPPPNTGPISIVLTMPEWAILGASITLQISTGSKADKIQLFIDGQLKRTWSDRLSASYTIQTSCIHRYCVSVVAWNQRYEDRTTRSVRVQYPVPSDADEQTWLQRAHDYARSFSPDDSESNKRAVWDAAYEALRYGTRYPVGEGGNALSERSESILAILQFSRDILNDHYWTTDGRIDSLTAYEMAQQFSTFDGTSPDAADFIAPDRGTSFDCADMASFISGMATALNIPSRLVSLTDTKAENHFEEDQEYFHLFAELYGITVGNNSGWFMVDPGHPQSCGSFSSYTSTEVIIDDFTQQDGRLSRLCFIWGMDYGEWGTSAGIDPTTCWLHVDPNADHYELYGSNPWGLIPGF